MNLLCLILGHKWASMKDQPNPRYHNCEWCTRCMEVKDWRKARKLNPNTIKQRITQPIRHESMTTPPTSVESWEKEFDEKFGTYKYMAIGGCANKTVKDFIHTLITRAKEEGFQEGINHDCFQHLDKAERVSRATYICHRCKKDVSTAYVLYQKAFTPTITSNETEV